MEEMLPSVLITGTSSGMGQATTKYLAEHGFRVYAGVRTQEDADKWQGTDNVKAVILDVTIQDTIEQVRQLLSHDDDFFGLVNNAGIVKIQGILDSSPELLERVFAVNLFGPIQLIKTFYPLLKKNKGRIINISSINGFLPSARDGGYSMAKHAMEALTEQLRFEISPDVGVSVIQPGLYKTDMVRNGLKDVQARYEAGEEWLKGVVDFWGNTENSRDPILIAETVYDILTTEKPSIRYVVAMDHLEQTLRKFLMSRILTCSFSHPVELENIRNELQQVHDELKTE